MSRHRPDTIELLNPTSGTADVSGWFLSDDFNNPKKFRIPNNTTISASGFVLFDESHFNVGPTAFALSSDSDEVWLFSADIAGNLTGYVHGFRFGAAEDGVTFGRHVTSTGGEHFVAQASRNTRFSERRPESRADRHRGSSLSSHGSRGRQRQLGRRVHRTAEHHRRRSLAL